MPKKRRIFIGYSLSEELQQTIVTWQDTFFYLPVRWITPRNLHITLIPPWYEENIPRVFSRLQAIQKFVSPFSIQLEHISFGPDTRRPRLLWARGETPKEFINLKTYLFEVLQKEIERHTPLLHVTLARFGWEQFASFPTKKLSEPIEWHDTVTSVTIFESHLKRNGAEYEKLAEIHLF